MGERRPAGRPSGSGLHAAAISRACIASARPLSTSGRKWLTRCPAGKYRHETGTCTTGTPAQAARVMTSVSYPNRSAPHRAVAANASGYTRRPHWLSDTAWPDSNQTSRLLAHRPRRLRAG